MRTTRLVKQIGAICLFSLVAMAMGKYNGDSEKLVMQGIVKMELQLLPVELDADEWESSFSIPFTRKIKQGNLPKGWTLAFDENKILRQQVDNQFDWMGMFVESIDRTTGGGFHYKEMACLKAKWPVELDEAEEEELDEPEIELLDEFKEILGFRCQRAFYKLEEGGWALWFAPDLKLPAELIPFLGKEGIPGMVFEMTEIPSPGMVSIKHLAVSQLVLEQPNWGEFSLPQDCESFSSSGEAKRKNLSLLKESPKEKNANSRARFNGPWKLLSDKGQIFMSLEEVKGNLHLKTFNALDGNVSEQEALITSEGLVGISGSGFQMYLLDEDSELLRRADHPAFSFLRIDQSEMDEALGL